MTEGKEKKVLITGASGLLGLKVVNLLREIGYSNVLGLVRELNDDFKFNQIKGDILDLGTLEDAMRGVQAVVHCAAMVSFDPRDKTKMSKINSEGTANIVNSCLALGVKELIYVSSVAALGKPTAINDFSIEATIDENQKWTDSPLNSNYASSKYQGECEVWRGEAEGLQVAVINPSIILGEGDWDKTSSRIFKYIWDENKFITNGFVNYVDVEDVAQIIEHVISQNKYGEKYILNGGKVSFKHFFDQIAFRLNKKAPNTLLSNFWISVLWRLEHLRSLVLGSKPLITKETSHSATSNYYFDSQKAKNDFGITFKTLDETLDRVCNYYLTKNRL